MDIQKMWRELDREKFQSLTIKREEIMEAISKESTVILSELKKRLRYKIAWVIFFLIAFVVWLAFSWKFTQTLPFISGLFLLYAVAGAMLWKNYVKMDGGIDPEKDAFSTMKNNAMLIRQALRSEKVFGMFAIPAAAIAGVVVPKLYTGMSLPDILSDTKYMLILLACLLILSPLMGLLSDKMNRIAYGEYIRKLEENILKMELLQ